MSASVLCMCADPHCPYCEGRPPESYIDAPACSPARHDIVRRQRDAYRHLAWMALTLARNALDLLHSGSGDVVALENTLDAVQAELVGVDR